VTVLPEASLRSSGSRVSRPVSTTWFIRNLLAGTLVLGLAPGPLLDLFATGVL
jgi:hypothetical protein